MIVTLRRLFWVALFGGAGYAGYQAWQKPGDADDSAPAAPEWPPIDTPPAASADAAPVAPIAGVSASTESPTPSVTATATGDQRWVEPIDGECPEGYPIKANDNSGIFHVPGGRFYNRTAPERCYANAEDAVADGYRAAKA